jgi:hypothetical protein
VGRRNHEIPHHAGPAMARPAAAVVIQEEVQGRVKAWCCSARRALFPPIERATSRRRVGPGYSTSWRPGTKRGYRGEFEFGLDLILHRLDRIRETADPGRAIRGCEDSACAESPRRPHAAKRPSSATSTTGRSSTPVTTVREAHSRSR